MYIGLDIRTLIFILGITNLMQVMVFYQQYRVNKSYQGIGWWLAWSAAGVIGFGIMLFRDIPYFLPFAIIIQNSMIIGGALFLYFGVRRFFFKNLKIELLIPIVLIFFVGLLYFLFINNNIQVRATLISATLAIISILTAHSLFVHKTRHVTSSANFLAGVFLVHGSFFMYRVVMIALGTQVEYLFTPTMFNYLTYFDALIVSLVWTFGFIIMLNQRLNAEISEAKEDLQLIFNTSPDAAIITRLDDGTAVYFNDGYSAIFGYSDDKISGKAIAEVNIWKNSTDRQKVFRLLKEQGYCQNYEALLLRKDGTIITALISAKVIHLQDIPYIISILRDITEREQAAKEIKLKNEELITINAEKDKFFSIIAHDLRSPFNGFLGLTQIMAEDLSSMTMPEIQQLAMVMRKSATNLFRLLENLLQWAKIQKGLISFNPVFLSLHFIVDESIAMIHETAKSKGIDICCTIPEDFVIFADINILQTVIRNLVSNAVKFTPKEGKIWISAKVVEDKSIEISIKDNGIGMDSRIIDNLFRIDVQTNRKGTNGEPSTGLGLLLCKELIEKHGGTIRVESSTEGSSGEKGSIFHLTIPNSPNQKKITDKILV
jgi:PAS domain S-box-containing protein